MKTLATTTLARALWFAEAQTGRYHSIYKQHEIHFLKYLK
jgi:hypothetical protein